PVLAERGPLHQAAPVRAPDQRRGRRHGRAAAPRGRHGGRRRRWRGRRSLIEKEESSPPSTNPDPATESPSMPLYQYDSPDRFVVGTVGPPGERTFFLQAVEGGRITSVVLEKAQVAALAERVGELLEEVRRRFGDAPDLHEVAESDNDPLQRPIEEEFRVGTLALAWDAQTRRVIVEAQQLRGPDESGESPRVQAFADDVPYDVLRVHLTPAEAR